MERNERHSKAAERLRKARKDYSYYYDEINITKSEIKKAKFGSINRCRLGEYYNRLSDYKHMIKVLEKEIRICKKEIYKAQKSYSKRYDRKETTKTHQEL